jgi:hypothetical protein
MLMVEELIRTIAELHEFFEFIGFVSNNIVLALDLFTAAH